MKKTVLMFIAALGILSAGVPGEANCMEGSAEACMKAAKAYSSAEMCAKDGGAKAVQLYEKACELGNADGCIAAGTSYEFYQGVGYDKDKAVALYKKACDMGAEAACIMAKKLQAR